MLKKILGEAQCKMTSGDFNEKVLAKIKAMPKEKSTSEQLKIVLLYNSLIIVLILSGILSYIYQLGTPLSLLESLKSLNVNVITVFISFTVFSFYVLISEIIDKKIFR